MSDRALASQTNLIRLMIALLAIGNPAAAAADCVVAAVWASPPVVNYQTVIGPPGGAPSLTAFIELPNGSAGDIDRNSITVNGFPVPPGPGGVGDANVNGIPDLMVKVDRSVLIASEGGLDFAGTRTSLRPS